MTDEEILQASKVPKKGDTLKNNSDDDSCDECDDDKPKKKRKRSGFWGLVQ